jgi:hypothetical protein
VSANPEKDRGRPVGDEPIRLAGPADIATWQAKMRAAVLDTVTEGEVREILKAIMERAKGGDMQAARMILAYAVGKPPREERADGPSRARPGTKRKLDALAYRHMNGASLHHPGDAKFGAEDDTE